MTDRLEEVFNHKITSSAEFRQVQRNHGLILAPENLRADPATREGCIELHKGLHWINLELAEFLFASKEERPEELADVLHFLVEVAILLGYDATIIPIHENATEIDRLDVMLWASEDNALVLSDPEANARFCIVASLLVANLLKNKPWKQTLKPAPDADELKKAVQSIFYWYGATVRTQGISAQELFDQFVRKDGINHTRVTTGV